MSIMARSIFVVASVCSILTSCNAISASLCARKLSSDESVISFLVKRNVKEIPLSYRALVNETKDCIVFMDLKWDEDVRLQFGRLNLRPTFLLPKFQIITINDDFEAAHKTVNVTLNRNVFGNVLGNTARSFAVIYNKFRGLHAPFIMGFKLVKARRLLCPDLASDFGSVSCTNGRKLGSTCTFQCSSGQYPSPDLFNPRIQSSALQAFRTSDNPKFVSTCSLYDRRRPAWKADVLTQQRSKFGVRWDDVSYYWKCVNRSVVRDVCLVKGNNLLLTQVLYEGLFVNEIFVYSSAFDCHYPISYLLKIFGQERNGEIVNITSSESSTSIPEILPGGTPPSTNSEDPIPTPVGREDESSSSSCTPHCIFDGASNSFAPACGNYATSTDQLDCLTCRFLVGCTQSSAVS